MIRYNGLERLLRRLLGCLMGYTNWDVSILGAMSCPTAGSSDPAGASDPLTARISLSVNIYLTLVRATPIITARPSVTARLSFQRCVVPSISSEELANRPGCLRVASRSIGEASVAAHASDFGLGTSYVERPRLMRAFGASQMVIGLLHRVGPFRLRCY